MPERFRPLLARAVDLIAADDVDGLRRDPQITLSGEDDPLYWVHYYPATVISLPDDAWTFAQVLPLADDVWCVWLDLWTTEEGRSDLTLEGKIRDHPEGPVIEIENIHVM